MKLNLSNLNGFCLKATFVLCIIVHFCTEMRAQFIPETFSQIRTGKQVKAMIQQTGGYSNYQDTVVDDKYSSMSTGAWRHDFKHKSVVDRITISVKDTNRAMSKFDYLFHITVDTFDKLQRHGSFNIVMRFSYDPASHKAYIDKSVFQFYNSHKFYFKITSIEDSTLSIPSSFSISNIQTNFTIESEIIVERYYLSPDSTSVNSLTHTFIGTNKLQISWVAPTSSAPNQYELEWAYIDTSGIKADSIRYNFRTNSSRVLLSKNSYVINTVYDAGAIVYRVRRVRPDSVYFKYNKYSNWRPCKIAEKGYLKNYPSVNKVYVSSHESMQKNWDYQVAFAEEGIKKEVVNYFDGSLKRRQGVTLLNTNNITLVDESIYDNHGRESIKIIPAPTDSSTLKYYTNFNQNAAGHPYSAMDFDTSTVMADKCNGNYKAQPLGNQSGAGKYYSANNSDKTNENAAIPDADGYPMTQTQLLPDPTGRVAAQGGVGKTHQLGSGHETQYSYGTANQNEMDKLFGSEMGIANHYKKNAVVDPNGQISVSYIDQHGRVVATALTGGVPGATDTLGNFKTGQFIMADLKNNTSMVNNALVTRYEFKVNTSGTHKLYYKLETPDFAFGCVGRKVCYTCQYDIQLILNDYCGNNLIKFKRPIGNLLDTNCSTPLVFNLKDSISKIGPVTVSLSGDSISFNLSAGNYSLYKVLTVNSDSIQAKIERTIENDSNCYKTFSSFLQSEYNQIDSSECECDTCFKELTYCESRKELMLEDVSPGGQYFTIDDGYIVSDSSSVLRLSGDNFNELYTYLDTLGFRNENGQLDSIWIGNKPYRPNKLGLYNFLTYWKPSWAEGLLPMHPEYCYYKYCKDSLEPSYEFDQNMMAIEEYDTAVKYGYLDPLDYKTEYTSIHDPFFFRDATHLNKKGVQFKTILGNLSGYTLGATQDPLKISVDKTDLWQFSKAIGYCENIKNEHERQSCFSFYYNSNTVKNNWMNDEQGRNNYWNKFKTLYYQLKQKFIEDTLQDTINANLHGQFCVSRIGPNCPIVAYREKESRFVLYDNNYTVDINADTIKAVKQELLDSLAAFSTCKSEIEGWKLALSQCEDYASQKDSIIYFFLKVCEAGSLDTLAPNILGSSDIPLGLIKNQRFTSFDQVLKHFIGSDYKNELCNIDLINSPRPSGTDYDNDKPKEVTPCVCDNLKEEIKLFKGCYSRKDSLELSVEGRLLNDFMNGLVSNRLLYLGSSTPTLSSLIDMTNVGDKLFAPILGGSASTISVKLLSEQFNTKTFVVYNGSDIKSGCRLTIQPYSFLTSNFYYIDSTATAIIKPISTGLFEYNFKKTTGGYMSVRVYTTCFNNIGKCSPNLSASDIDSFTNFFNFRHNSTLSNNDIVNLVSECSEVSIPNIVIENNKTVYEDYFGTCYKFFKEDKDIFLLSILNEMMRDSVYWDHYMAGADPGDCHKRFLTTYEPEFHCNKAVKADFLTKTRDYGNYWKAVNVVPRGDNYWWVYPTQAITTCHLFDTTYYDTAISNNRTKDPYFVGGYWLGAKCDVLNDSFCFTSFGDPFKMLGTLGRPTINEIDSIYNLRWGDDAYQMLVTVCNRSHPADSVILTFRSDCKQACQIYQFVEIPINFKEIYVKPGTSGINGLKNVSARVGIKTEYTNPFMDMINGLASKHKLTDSTHQTLIATLHKSFPFPNYFDVLIPKKNGYMYKLDSGNNFDSVLIGRLGTSLDSTNRQYCKFGLCKTGNSRGYNFGAIVKFKDIMPDEQAIADAMANDQIDMAGYHFTLKGAVVVAGDTTWYPLKGWSSCWKFSEMAAITGNKKSLLNLPPSFVGNCNCLTCPESKRWADSLYAEYPRLYPSHPNYETIVANYINRKLNNQLSFSEIQSMWDQCGVANHMMIKTPVADYRIAVKNTDCVGHSDTALRRVMDQTGYSFGVQTIKNADSTIYYLDFSGLFPNEIDSICDTITKYFSSPYCTATNRWKNYRDGADIEVISVNDTFCTKTDFDDWFNGVKSGLFGSAAITNNSYTDIKYSSQFAFNLPPTSTWMAKLNIQVLNFSQRIRFMDTLNAWSAQCGATIIRKYFYTPVLKTGTSGESICLNSDSFCYSCDTFIQRVLNYQYEVAATRKNPGAAMSADSLEIYLSDALNRRLNVYNGSGTCVTCGDKSALFVCEETSERLDSIVSLLNKVATAKKLASASYSLGSTYTALLNKIKPAGTVLNNPSYQCKASADIGFKVTLKYNNYLSDVITVYDNDDYLIRKFKQGTVQFKHPIPVPGAGTVSSFIVYSVDSLYHTNTYTCTMPGLKVTKCCELPATTLCPQPYAREFIDYSSPCNTAEKNQAYINAGFRYQSYLDSIRHNLRLSYETHCLSKAGETFMLGSVQQRYHVTLYYYDQAGNLVKTVPPQGVAELTLNTNKNDSILAYRNEVNTTNKFVNTFHTLGTNYKYNSLNQLVWQQTPDGGTSRFWYDRLGRLILSQNAVQKARSSSGQKVYSYTRYDALGRITEVGEITNTAIDSSQMILDLAYYNTWLDTCTARTQITRTFYDYPVVTLANNQFAAGQQNLRGRVSSVMYYDYYAADSSLYTRATHYSYDIHGNVDHLVHDFPDMENLGNRFKHLAYTYDLISGKVHSVAYQAGQSDQWFHRYDYDADNRLILAETSTDSVIWDKDAEYKYYKHGPLARTLLGENMVQGIDYAYTLHGWLKGVNSNTLQATRDIGKDGTGVLRKYTARDAYGFTLGYFTDNTGTAYFDGDYKSIATTGFEAATTGSPLANTAANLYNGNITHMVTAVSVLMSRNSNSPVATAYRYDQLNRISSVFSYNGINMSGNSWNSGSLQSKWKEKFRYDANGNITKLTRYSATGVMDSLTYNYKSRTNQLTSVDDIVSSGSYGADVDDQNSNNYMYDAIGNLTKDKAEEIDSIYWNVYGKIKAISRTATSTRPALEFRYDAAGQRVLKIVKRSSSESDWDYTWYVRDAQGNVMATYTKKSVIQNGDSSLYRKINNAIVSNMNTDSLGEFIKHYFKGSQFEGALAQAVADKNMMAPLVDLYAADSLLNYNSSFASQCLQNYCTYYTTSSPRKSLDSLMWLYMRDSVLGMIDQGCYATSVLLQTILSFDGTNDYLLNALATNNAGSFNTMYTLMGGPPFPPPSTAQMIIYMRTFPNSVISTNIMMQYNLAALESVITGLNTTLLDNTYTATGRYADCDLIGHAGGCDYDTTWYGFVRDYMPDTHVKNIITQSSSALFVANLLIEKDGQAFKKIASLGNNLIADALRETPDLDISKYLGYIYKRFGRTMFNSILGDIGDTIKIQRSLTLDELHIYGSSRHGIHKPKRQLVRKNYELTSVNSDGGLSLSNVVDSSQFVMNFHYFKRTLTYKQYELTNHLGNVLATILDRKTFVQDSTGQDTLLYYKADVSTAGLYYAFGSAIQEMIYTQDTCNSYRFGFNKQEKDNEMAGEGDYYAFEYRIHDAKLGRFLSVDPLTKEYPFYSTYQFAGNMPIVATDIEGKEPKICTVNNDTYKPVIGFIGGTTAFTSAAASSTASATTAAEAVTVGSEVVAGGIFGGIVSATIFAAGTVGSLYVAALASDWGHGSIPGNYDELGNPIPFKAPMMVVDFGHEVITSNPETLSDEYLKGVAKRIADGSATLSDYLYESEIHRRSSTRPTWQQSERTVKGLLGDGYRRQVSFINRGKADYGEKGSVRPDLWNQETKHAVEIKNYKANAKNISGLINKVAAQTNYRDKNLPKGSSQTVYLDIRGQNLTDEQANDYLNKVKAGVEAKLDKGVKVEIILLK